MIWAALGGGLTVLAFVATQAWWLHSANRDKDNCRDLLDGERKEHVETRESLRLAEMNAKALTGELALTKELLATAQAQRNEAMESARDHFVQRLQSSGASEAANLVADLLATPIAAGVPPRKRSEDAKDGLLDPAKG